VGKFACKRGAEPAHKSISFPLMEFRFHCDPSALINLDRLTTMHEYCHSTELLRGEESLWVLRKQDCPCRPEGQNSRCYLDAATASCRSLDVVVRCGAQTSGMSEKESFPNPQRLASVVPLRGRAMDENKSIKTNVSFESAGLKLAGHLYTPGPDTSPSLPAIVVGSPGSSARTRG
jgi:hypothetical protein